MTDKSRLIEVAFPLRQTSLDSVHEKNVRHGHISTLHIWPARRPLAACRAALIATLLPDPGDAQERKEILERLGGRLVKKVKRHKTDTGWVEETTEETEGGILHWGRENGPDLDWFRQKIREAYGGRAPKVLDPFAGGGAIPLEAMRLGCEATAVDINPVAWFILKCTLEYPQKLAGQTRPLPDFALRDREFMTTYFKAQGYKGAALETRLERMDLANRPADAPRQTELPGMDTTPTDQPQAVGSQATTNNQQQLSADLAWHVRAWGRWVLAEARKELARFYPTYADFEPLIETAGKIEQRPMQLVPLRDDGTPDIDALNAEFSPEYLADKRKPRWVVKPTVAYLWARTVTCKNCRATVPLLKTRWLCKKDSKRVVLTMQPNPMKTGIVFGVQCDVPVSGKTTAERKAHDAREGGGTMSRSGAACPCCGAIMTTEDIRLEGQAGRLGQVMTAVVLEGQKGKEYRRPTEHEIQVAEDANGEIEKVYSQIPFGLPSEPTPAGGGSGAGRAFSVQGYGFCEWSKLFTGRQLLSLGVLIIATRCLSKQLDSSYREKTWIEAIFAYLAILLDRTANYMSTLCIWEKVAGEVKQTFLRFALPITWDFAESNPLSGADRYYAGAISNVEGVLHNITTTLNDVPTPKIYIESATIAKNLTYDAIITDPPYYDAIPYSDLMDFFYIWLRRCLFGIQADYKNIFEQPLCPKWDKDNNDGELIDDSSRHGNDQELSKRLYENGMAKAFTACNESLSAIGRLVIVFANKNPSAWETLVSAIIRAGFVVTGTWPIATEMRGGVRNFGRASLGSSIWLVCKKRSATARPGWDNKVLEEMRANITTRLRDFWDAGIRGPDFVWAATGPALEAYSRYPVVKKANEQGQIMGVSEFLGHVRRIVVDFVVGRVLSADGQAEVSGLDAATTYYLLHRHDFGLNEAPAGACILYAVSCGLSDKDLADRYDLLARQGGREAQQEDDADGSGDDEEASGDDSSSGGAFRLKAWSARRRPGMGYEAGELGLPHARTGGKQAGFGGDFSATTATGGKEVPLIDQVHRLMHLWKTGEVQAVDEYLDRRGLRRNPLFHPLLQALIELSSAGSDERALMESISNHVGGQNRQRNRLL